MDALLVQCSVWSVRFGRVLVRLFTCLRHITWIIRLTQYFIAGLLLVPGPWRSHAPPFAPREKANPVDETSQHASTETEVTLLVPGGHNLCWDDTPSMILGRAVMVHTIIQ